MKKKFDRTEFFFYMYIIYFFWNDLESFKGTYKLQRPKQNVGNTDAMINKAVRSIEKISALHAANTKSLKNRHFFFLNKC